MDIFKCPREVIDAVGGDQAPVVLSARKLAGTKDSEPLELTLIEKRHTNGKHTSSILGCAFAVFEHFFEDPLDPSSKGEAHPLGSVRDETPYRDDPLAHNMRKNRIVLLSLRPIEGLGYYLDYGFDLLASYVKQLDDEGVPKCDADTFPKAQQSRGNNYSPAGRAVKIKAPKDACPSCAGGQPDDEWVWRPFSDPASGRPYFYNTKTRLTQWTPPSELNYKWFGELKAKEKEGELTDKEETALRKIKAILRSEAFGSADFRDPYEDTGLKALFTG